MWCLCVADGLSDSAERDRRVNLVDLCTHTHTHTHVTEASAACLCVCGLHCVRDNVYCPVVFVRTFVLRDLCEIKEEHISLSSSDKWNDIIVDLTKQT